MKYKNRLTFAYYSITFWNFKSRQGVQIPISRYFFSNYRHRLVLEIPFPDHIFPKISIPCWKSSFPVYRQTLRPRPPALHISHCNVIYPSQDSSLYLASTLNVVNLILQSSNSIEENRTHFFLADNTWILFLSYSQFHYFFSLFPLNQKYILSTW